MSRLPACLRPAWRSATSSPLRPLPAGPAVVCYGFLLPSQVAGQWLDFEDHSSAPIVTDSFEKDFEVGDVDRDGDLDVVVVRKERFPNSFGNKVKRVDVDGNGFLGVLLSAVDTDFEFCDRQSVTRRNNRSQPTPDISDPLVSARPDWMPIGTFDMVGADFDGDGRRDTWAGTCNGNRLDFAINPLFADGFESADTGAWSASAP